MVSAYVKSVDIIFKSKEKTEIYISTEDNKSDPTNKHADTNNEPRQGHSRIERSAI